MKLWDSLMRSFYQLVATCLVGMLWNLMRDIELLDLSIVPKDFASEMVDAMKRTFSHVGFASIWISDEFCVVVEALWIPFFKLGLGLFENFFLWWWLWKVFLDTMKVWTTWPSCFVCLKLAILWADYHVKIMHRNICPTIIYRLLYVLVPILPNLPVSLFPYSIFTSWNLYKPNNFHPVPINCVMVMPTWRLKVNILPLGSKW